MIPVLLTAASSYLLGSIPFGYILIRLSRGQDIRRSGSGNIGATNVARSSPGLGALTLVLDAGKGLLAAYLAILIANRTRESSDDNRLYLMMSLAALFAILGHVFPVWLNFRGGKGVATAVGAFILLAPYAMLAAVGVFLVVVLVSRYVSLSSVAATAVFPLFAWFLYREYFSRFDIVVMCMTSIFIIARHHQNIGRLLSGTEPRFHLRHS
ncbi:MAG: acyl-phosphate glycerol 3-phosphate acyltransferase [Acidobacteria bacterium]|nr:MAG: acyl-phosphate glycerol 3-phosphate acyltransferase [Acidobacteriota bacterium]